LAHLGADRRDEERSALTAAWKPGGESRGSLGETRSVRDDLSQVFEVHGLHVVFGETSRN
jgi:hypothetical protein